MALAPQPRSSGGRPTAPPVASSRRPQFRGLPRPTRVLFAGGEWQVPAVCCCCGGGDPAEAYAVENGPDAAVEGGEPGDGVTFPLCGYCLEWMSVTTRIPSNRGFWLPLVGSLGCAGFAWYLAAATALTPDPGNSVLVWVLIGLAAALIPVALLMYSLQTNQIDRLTARAWYLKPGPVCVLRPVVYVGRRGDGHVFLFTNPKFTDEIARLNAARVAR